MRELLKNLRYSLRTWRDHRGLILTILLTIALGIGANTAIFTVVYATLLAPAPYPQPHQLVNVWSKIHGERSPGVSAGDFNDWRQRSTVFQELNASITDNFNVATKDRPEFLDGLYVTPGYLGMLGNPLFLGRHFLPEEGRAGKEHVVILTNRLWSHLGGDPKIVGKTMQINGDPYTVVGVLAPGTADRFEWELTVPLVLTAEQIQNHDSRYLSVTGRLKGITIQQAQAEMEVAAAQQAREHPKTNQGWAVAVDNFRNDLLPAERRWTLWLLLGAVGLLLGIACLNIANLLLAKGITRQREVAVRGALGASPSSIFGQFLTESLVLAAIGGLLGVGVGTALLRGVVAAMPANALPAEADLRLNFSVLVVMLTAATLAGVLFGCAPAWYASRLDLAGMLKDGGHAGIGVTRHWLRRILVVAEFAMALPLLTGAGLAIHSLWNLTHLDLGVRTDHILGCYLDSVSLEKNPTPPNVNAYYRRILPKIASLPGVKNVCAMTYLPLDFFTPASMPFSIAGRSEYLNSSRRPIADLQMVTPMLFKTFGIRILQGRDFTEHDDESSTKVAMVNEVFVNRFLKGVDPLRQQVVMDEMISGSPNRVPAVKWQIVGVFHTVKSRASRADNPEIDVPFWQEAASVSAIAVQTVQDPAIMIKSISTAVNSVDPEAALALTRTMTQVHDGALANDRFTVILFASFAGIALLLTTVGIYGVMAFSVTQRSYEIALRMALGATRNRVVRLVVREGLALAGVGVGLGCVGAFFVGRTMHGVLFSIGTLDSATFCAVALLSLIAALLASGLPAIRAASMEAMQMLRRE